MNNRGRPRNPTNNTERIMHDPVNPQEPHGPPFAGSGLMNSNNYGMPSSQPRAARCGSLRQYRNAPQMGGAWRGDQQPPQLVYYLNNPMKVEREDRLEELVDYFSNSASEGVTQLQPPQVIDYFNKSPRQVAYSPERTVTDPLVNPSHKVEEGEETTSLNLELTLSVGDSALDLTLKL